MEIMVLLGQRKQRYGGEYPVEALAVIDEAGDSENPEYMIEKRAEYAKSGEFDALAVVCLGVSDAAIQQALYPKSTVIPATVKN